MLVSKYSAVGAVLLLLYVSTASSQNITTVRTSPSTATPECDESVCPAYCDEHGNAQESEQCEKDEYCCGDEYNRYCCDNETESLKCRYDDVHMCYSWWIFNWQMALAMLGTVVLLLTISACCCQCFAHKTNQRAFQRAEASAERRRRRGDLATIEMEENPPREQVFDPNSVHAFQPPDYAKDPPKYQDIDFGSSSGETNPAFSAEEGVNPSSGLDILPPPPSEDDSVANNDDRQVTPPPPYTLYETVEDNEVDLEVSTAASNSSSPRVIRVSGSPTTVDNTQSVDSEQSSAQTVNNSPV